MKRLQERIQQSRYRVKEVKRQRGSPEISKSNDTTITQDKLKPWERGCPREAAFDEEKSHWQNYNEAGGTPQNK